MKRRDCGTKLKWYQTFVARRKFDHKRKFNGTVYVLQMELEGKTLFKIGASSRSANKRTGEILCEIEYKYGYFPRTRIVKSRQCKDYYRVEAALHERFKKNWYKTQHEFSGSSEVFDITLADILEWYDWEINQDRPVDKKQDVSVTAYNGL